MLASRKFATLVIAKLNVSQGTSSVTLTELAAELGVPVERLQPLLDHEYLRRLSLDTVIRPQPAAMAWLRTMFLPLSMRPWISTGMAAEIVDFDKRTFRTLCLMYDIPFQDDPAFGELMSIASFHRFINALHHVKQPTRFDRQGLLHELLKALPKEEGLERGFPELPFSKRLDMELRRIARMPEPERTFRAVAFLEAYRDAKGIMDAYARYKGLTEVGIQGMEKLERLVEKSVGEATA